ncbi:hypothetical protein CEXT_532231 [Caerostris extrusa]|uniref:Uncharacterized protein n=1 Tax=Caerostris extrusa TaxID=172846 RepID=A0AAV4SXM8_CAEEX|nr:hypothetical protein CEXT_532231 [Caerostris extrusa]
MKNGIYQSAFIFKKKISFDKLKPISRQHTFWDPIMTPALEKNAFFLERGDHHRLERTDAFVGLRVMEDRAEKTTENGLEQ